MPVRVSQGDASRVEPEVDSIRTAQALLYIIRRPGFDSLFPCGENVWQVIWVNACR